MHQEITATKSENTQLRAEHVKETARTKREQAEKDLARSQHYFRYSESDKNKIVQGEIVTHNPRDIDPFDPFQTQMRQYKARIIELQEAAKETDKHLHEQNNEILKYEREAKTYVARIKVLESENEDLRKQVEATTSEIGVMSNELAEVRWELADRKRRMEEGEVESRCRQHEDGDSVASVGEEGDRLQQVPGDAVASVGAKKADEHPLLELIRRGQGCIIDSRKKGVGHQYLISEIVQSNKKDGEENHDEGKSEWIAAYRLRRDPLGQQLVNKFHRGHADKPRPYWVKLEDEVSR